jgi:hypothetical protein
MKTSWVRSPHLSYFQQHGRIYVMHNLNGNLLAMSPDLVDLLEFFVPTARDSDAAQDAFGGRWAPEDITQFLTILEAELCLQSPEVKQDASMWDWCPLQAKWVVFHQPSDEELTFWRTDRAEASHAEPVEDWAARLWSDCDGETSLRTLYERACASDIPEPTEESFLALVRSWVQWERQYLKMAMKPLSAYSANEPAPSYLFSTMPYEPWNPEEDPAPEDPLDPLACELAPPHAYYEHQIADSAAQFDDVETTLSHLLRSPCEASFQKSFGEHLFTAFHEANMVHENTRKIVEVGGGLGDLAANFLSTMRRDLPQVFEQVHYTIFDLSPELQKAQKARLEAEGLADKVTWVQGNAETMDLGEGSVDLLLANEMIGDFSTVRMDETCAPGADQGLSPEQLAIVGEVRKWNLPLDDPPESFFVNLGAFRFLERIQGVLADGGCAYMSEFGEPDRYPVASTHLDHLEFSIHFGHLEHVAKELGFHTQLVDLPDWVHLNTAVRTLTSTRTYFKSLRALLRSVGVVLPKRALTRAEFEELLDDRISADHIGALRFAPAQSRIMGLVPQEFKALLLSRSPDRF